MIILNDELLALRDLYELWNPDRELNKKLKPSYSAFKKNKQAILRLIHKQSQLVKDVLIESIFNTCKNFFYKIGEREDEGIFLQLFTELSEERRAHVAWNNKLYKRHAYAEDEQDPFYFDQYRLTGMVVAFNSIVDGRQSAYVQIIKKWKSMQCSVVFYNQDNEDIWFSIEFENFNDGRKQLLQKNIAAFSLKNILDTLEYMEKMSHTKYVFASHIAKITTLLPEKDRERFANAALRPACDMPGDVFCFIDAILPEDQISFLDKWIKECTGRDLGLILEKLHEKNRYLFLKKYFHKIADREDAWWVKISVYDAIKWLSPQEAFLVAQQCIEKISNFNELTMILAHLQVDKRHAFARMLCNMEESASHEQLADMLASSHFPIQQEKLQAENLKTNSKKKIPSIYIAPSELKKMITLLAENDISVNSCQETKFKEDQLYCMTDSPTMTSKVGIFAATAVEKRRQVVEAHINDSICCLWPVFNRASKKLSG